MSRKVYTVEDLEGVYGTPVSVGVDYNRVVVHVGRESVALHMDTAHALASSLSVALHKALDNRNEEINDYLLEETEKSDQERWEDDALRGYT